jgi:hypothetical protein
LISSSYTKKTTDKNKSWFTERQKEYKFPDLTKIEDKELFQNNINTQWHFFYDDKDGKASFSHFLSTYKNDPNWKIEDNPNYVKLSKTNPKN